MRVSLLLVVGAFLFVPANVSAQEYYECVVAVDAANGAACEDFRGRMHMCQLYDGYSGTGVPEHCSRFCVDRSKIPAECAHVSVRESSNPEAHSARAGVLEQVPVNTEVLEDIAGELQEKLEGIENEVNTEDGISQEEVSHIVGRVVDAIKEIIGNNEDTSTTDESTDQGVFDTAVAWSKKDLFCSDKPRFIQKGEIASVSGDGEAWIERGLKTYKAVAGAPLMGGDIVTVPGDMEVELTLHKTGTLKVSQRTRFLIPNPSAQERQEQCVRGAIQNRVTNGIRNGWVWFKHKLQGEQYEIKTPTVSGVRG